MPTPRLIKHGLITFALFGCTVLTGCGTKGPLYIPEQRYPQKTQEEAPAKSPQNNDSSQPTKE